MQPRHRRPRFDPQRGALGGNASEPLPSLADLMQQLEGLETRLHQLKTGLTNLVQLQQIDPEVPTADIQRSAVELTQLQEAADRFELELANRVISWEHLKDTFWQALRFGGLGLVVGWALAWFVYGR
jgi:hypothetical protein